MSNGSKCANDDECASGFCVDSVCCDKRCDGQCQACDVTGNLGTCYPVAGAAHGVRPKCSDGAGDVCAATTCNGAKDISKCVDFASGSTTQCKPATCAGDVFTPAAYCDGVGACRAGEAKSCAPYVCSETGCRTECSANEHCAAGNVCNGGKCTPNLASCSADGLSSVKDGASTSCAPYRCRSDGTCGTNCTVSSDCAPGRVCDSAGQCADAPAPTEDSGGCAVASAGTERASGVSTLVLAALALAALGRRRSARTTNGLNPSRAARGFVRFAPHGPEGDEGVVELR